LQEIKTQETVTPWSVGDGESPMAMSWELNVKPSFLTDLLALPNKKVARQVQEKVEDLQRDPRPDGHTRKKIKSRKNPVYRLRVGDYRLLYTFGTGWIRLLGIRLHHQGYDDESIDYEEPKVVPRPALNAPEEDAVPLGVPAPSVTSATPTPSAAVERPLPRPLTSQFLSELRVPLEYHALLESCTDEKSLLDAAVPQDVQLRIVEGLFPQTVEQMLQQPDLVLDRSEDLVRFAEGQMSLKDFLLRLDPDQEKAVAWDADELWDHVVMALIDLKFRPKMLNAFIEEAGIPVAA
jgi:mRNA-degrading endonuclease RelE of RelBE toxin-antitoxin system